MATPGFTDSIFQSTLSVRRATRVYTGDTKILLISIHALRKESDLRSATELPKLDIFQSTLSVRRATVSSSIIFPFIYISIHALRKESDFHAGIARTG